LSVLRRYGPDSPLRSLYLRGINLDLESTSATSRGHSSLTGMTTERRGMYGVMDGEKIQEMRQGRGLSRRQLAQEAGISMNTLRSGERGERVRAATARRVARVFELHPREIGRPATS
jgi:DNA-binding transcriptional regulator YiaG